MGARNSLSSVRLQFVVTLRFGDLSLHSHCITIILEISLKLLHKQWENTEKWSRISAKREISNLVIPGGLFVICVTKCNSHFGVCGSLFDELCYVGTSVCGVTFTTESYQ